MLLTPRCPFSPPASASLLPEELKAILPRGRSSLTHLLLRLLGRPSFGVARAH